MKKNQVMAGAALVAAVTLTLSACGSDPAPETTPSNAPEPTVSASNEPGTSTPAPEMTALPEPAIPTPDPSEIAATKSVIFVQTTGFECPQPYCSQSFTLNLDGSWFLSNSDGLNETGQVSAEEMTAIIDRLETSKIPDAPKPSEPCTPGLTEGTVQTSYQWWTKEKGNFFYSTCDKEIPASDPVVSVYQEITSDFADKMTFVGETATSAPTPSANPALLKVTRSGGLCADGSSCENGYVVYSDGSWETFGLTPVEKGTLTGTEVKDLTNAISETQLENSAPFEGTCPIAYDGQKTVLSYTVSGKEITYDSCEVEFPTEDPLVLFVENFNQ